MSGLKALSRVSNSNGGSLPLTVINKVVMNTNLNKVEATLQNEVKGDANENLSVS